MRKVVDAATFWVKIYIAGPIEVAKHIIRREAVTGSLCVTVEPTHYIYRQGEEAGYVVGLINYPRFPLEERQIEEKAEALMETLLRETYQGSALYMSPSTTRWVSYRDTD